MVQIWCKTSAEKRNSHLKEGGQKAGRNETENRHLQAKELVQTWHKYVTEIGKLLGNSWVTQVGQKLYRSWTELYQLFTTALPENGGICRKNVGEINGDQKATERRPWCHRLVTNMSPEIKSLKFKKWYQVGTKVIPKNCINSTLKLHQNSCVKVSARFRWFLCKIKDDYNISFILDIYTQLR